MNVSKILMVAVSALMLSATVAEAADLQKVVDARRGLMKQYGFNLGILGAMAKGKVEYDATKAAAAAHNLKLATSFDQSAYWPAGSSLDNIELKTEAKPEIWTTYPDVVEKGKAATAAAAALAQVAGNGLDALKGSIGDVGKSCGGCHKPFRQKD